MTPQGDSWISPIDYVNAWGPFLYSSSLLDGHERDQVQQSANVVANLVKKGQWANATSAWGTVENQACSHRLCPPVLLIPLPLSHTHMHIYHSPQITSLTDDVSFYNILRHHTDGDEAAVAALAASSDTQAAQRLFADPRGRALAQRHLASLHAQSLSQLMNGPVRTKLGVRDRPPPLPPSPPPRPPQRC